jgi:hypothetical protein
LSVYAVSLSLLRDSSASGLTVSFEPSVSVLEGCMILGIHVIRLFRGATVCAIGLTSVPHEWSMSGMYAVIGGNR